MVCWWDSYPKRYKDEIDAFKDAGLGAEIDEESFAKGKLVLKVRYPIEGEILDLVVTFPDAYPFFRPQVSAPKIKLLHHHSPIDKVLCLLIQNTESWNVSETAHDLIVQQLPKAIEAGMAKDRKSVAAIEIHQAEPRSEYYQYNRNAVLIIDGAWNPWNSANRGTFSVAFEHGATPHESIVNGLRGAVLTIKDESENVICSADDRLASTAVQERIGRERVA